MQKLRGSPGIIVLLFYFSCLWSRITALCPVRCQCNDKSLRAVCNGANLDLVPITLNPELKELHLSNNSIKGIQKSLDVYRQLEYLDFSHNQLVTLSEENFAISKSLNVLLLNANMISFLQNNTFNGARNLTVLYLNENILNDITPKLFSSLSKLELLDLSQNRIASLNAESFFGLKNLKTLLLRDNMLDHIPSQSFQYIPGLIKLDLGLNAFVDIPENAFDSLRNLQELFLDGCAIVSIQYGAFKWLNSLLSLRIDDNTMEEIPTKALYDVIRLEELHIGQNKFREIGKNAFERLKYLKTVEVNASPFLERIAAGSFTYNTNLNKLVVNHNKILKHIQKGAFDNLPHLRYVSFRGNAFQTLQSDLLPWDDLHYLDVRDNPLVCNCSLLWLWKLLTSKNFTNTEGPHDITQVECSGPKPVKNQILVDLSSDDLDCFDLDARRQIVIGVIVAGCVAIAAIVMIGFKYRDKVAGVLKTRWGRGRKEPQYQKTSAEEESTILQAAQQSLKMTPVTEL